MISGFLLRYYLYLSLLPFSRSFHSLVHFTFIVPRSFLARHYLLTITRLFVPRSSYSYRSFLAFLYSLVVFLSLAFFTGLSSMLGLFILSFSLSALLVSMIDWILTTLF